MRSPEGTPNSALLSTPESSVWDAARSAQAVAAVCVQFALLVAVWFAFRLQSEAFRRVALLLLVAFPVNHYLPPRFRLTFFNAVSLTSIFLVADLPSALWIIGLGSTLIGLCHLPVTHGRRVALVVGAAAILALGRIGWLPVPWSDLVFSLLGAMFMFRMIIYLYDMKHAPADATPLRAFGYFFMAPNICFPLFPVVDYKTFVRTYFDRDAVESYQTGLHWMLRGTVQLILYRAVYLYVAIAPEQVSSLSSMLRYVIGTYLLYLNVSGMFHVIVGMLRLFGFGLPETFHRYYLATSFSDFWRRVNIYWKDFIMKIFFYPMFFRVRRLGQTQAIVLATAVSFFATWALHSYQFFWLRGVPLLTAPDTIFWAVLGALVVANSVVDAQKKPRRARRSRAREAAATAAATVGVFFTIAFLWSLWSSSSIDEWLSVLRAGSNVGPADVVVLAMIVAIVSIAAVAYGGERERKTLGRPAARTERSLSAAWVGGAACAMLVLAFGPAQRLLPEGIGTLLSSLERSDQLSARDLASLQRGYYEDLTQVHRFSQELSALYGERPPDYFDTWKQTFNRPTGDYLEYDMAPSARLEYLQVAYSTNRWGMRDRDYDKAKAPGTYRIALLGSSTTLGWGVGDDETFEAIAEERLNAPAGRSDQQPSRWELLNFGANGYDPVRKLILLEERVFDFSPDAVVQLADSNDAQTVIGNLIKALQARAPLPYPFLDEVVRRAGVERGDDEAAMKVKLAPFAREILEWAMQRFASEARERGIDAYWMLLPETTGWYDQDAPELIAIAERSGFAKVADLRPAFSGVPVEQLRIFSFDFHSNPRGHRLVADRFIEALPVMGGAAEAEGSATR